MMTIKDLQPANDPRTPDSQQAAAESQEVLSLEELANRQQAAMAKLKESTSTFDNLLEETVVAVDETINQSKNLTNEIKDQAAEKAAAMLAEAKIQAQTIISEADKERRVQALEATGQVRDIIEAAKSSAGRAARPDWDKLPLLTGEIRAALEASIEQSLKSMLKDLQSLEQETNLSDGQEGPQAKAKNAAPYSAGLGHSENNTEPLHSNGFEAEMNDSTSTNTNPDVDDSQGDGDIESSSKEKQYGMAALRQSGAEGSNNLAMGPRLYLGEVILVIILKKVADQSTNHMTPDQISHQIKNTPGGSVIDSGMLGREYFIEARFQTTVSLHEVLNGVSDWEDFEHQSDKVKQYQKRAWAVDPLSPTNKSKDARRILVTL